MTIEELREAIAKQEKHVAKQSDLWARKREAEKLNLMIARLRDLERLK